MAGRVLTATWRDLIIASYRVDPALLKPHLPPGLELDRYQGDAVCSLVGFRFLDTKVLGVRWPGLVDFPEINLRFYVREPGSGRRGVVFIQELVRSRVVALVARTLYNEPYVRARIDTSVLERTHKGDSTFHAEYTFACRGGTGRMMVQAEPDPFTPPEDSTEHWFKEHQWGYGRTRHGRTLRYEVRHPVWACRRVRQTEIDVDFSRIYSPAWNDLANAQPISVVLALGSPVEVFGSQAL